MDKLKITYRVVSGLYFFLIILSLPTYNNLPEPRCDNYNDVLNLNMGWIMTGFTFFYGTVISMLLPLHLIEKYEKYTLYKVILGLEFLFLNVWMILGYIVVYHDNIECLSPNSYFARYVQSELYLNLLITSNVILQFIFYLCERPWRTKYQTIN